MKREAEQDIYKKQKKRSKENVKERKWKMKGNGREENVLYLGVVYSTFKCCIVLSLLNGFYSSKLKAQPHVCGLLRKWGTAIHHPAY